MPDTTELTQPAIGAGESAWREHAQQLREQLETAERARRASRMAANRRSSLLNAIERDLTGGDVPRALDRLARRAAYAQEARR